MRRSLRLITLALMGFWTIGASAGESDETCSCTVVADVVAFNTPWQASRLGSTTPQGMIYALAQDVVPNNNPVDQYGNDLRTNRQLDMDLQPGQVRLRSGKRARPLVLRVNEGECLQINFQNLLIGNDNTQFLPPTGIHVAGLEAVAVNGQEGIVSDGTYVGTNPSGIPASGGSITYKLYARKEGVYFLYDDAGYNAGNDSLQAGLFGAVNVQPPRGEYYRSQVTREELAAAALQAKNLKSGQDLLPALDVNGKARLASDGSTLYRFSQHDEQGQPFEATVVLDAEGRLNTEDGHPILNYMAVDAEGFPILRMDWPSADGKTRQLLYSDLTAMITGPNAGAWPLSQNNPAFTQNPASPNRRQPYREFSIIYHQIQVTQLYANHTSAALTNSLNFGEDGFAINYGSAGIADEVLANRIGVGPQGYHGDGADLKFEEFFLSSWAVGDPALLTDVPAIVQSGEQGPERDRATLGYYPDDPSNVYHSYIRDHVKFRIINVNGIPHVHHLHAHQWLHSPNSSDGHYLDSQLISGGSTYTAEITYNGSGNRNQIVGDSIFHCHFYPHFAQGLWSLWRVHDVFEDGTQLNPDGTVQTVDAAGKTVWNRALPDGEIASGTPIPGLVPLPTLAMAPIPAKVRLANSSDPTIDGLEMAGRRAIVDPVRSGGEVVVDSEGFPTYENPGYPFFIPAVAGHRPMHPPMDYGWVEDPEGNPVLDPNGEKILLDGGLPRHQALDGEIVRNLFTVYDFSRDFVLFKNEDKGQQSQETYLTGSFTAYQVPEEGTAVERAAMDFHAQRSHRSYLPNGKPGNFITNGLPPVPGAPYAAPNVDDEGSSVGNLIKYKAADIQTDVVFNKKGWHYPQQRMITLWDDVAPTIQGDRPPEPFFFRSHSGDSIEFWHTNLIPNYYDMDDFQVRTPTDILGQHIHLVKFDVTSSDGAGNGFNYEDGTFSPDEVRERIIALNNNGLGATGTGGIYGFDPATQFASNETSQLQLKLYEDYYQFGLPPYGQNWDGAQTTIQRWYSDPFVNNAGDDRTLRTVFTHDHFSPSTHQQAGLYAGLLVEPEGSNWFTNGLSFSKPGSYYRLDPSGQLVAYTSEDGTLDPGTKMLERRDGGPTSWQAMVIGAEPATSYREFALEFQDLALAYLPGSNFQTQPQQAQQIAQSAPVFVATVTAITPGPVAGLNPELAQVFASNGVILSDTATVQFNDGLANQPCGYCEEPPSNTAYIVINTQATSDGVTCLTDYYNLTTATCSSGSADELCFNVYTPCWAPTWYQPSQAIGNVLLFGSSPTLISGFPFSGSYTTNYTSEPIPYRVDTRASFDALPSSSVDLANAFNSIERLDAQLNVQPVGGNIDPTQTGQGGYSPTEALPFTFPKNLLNSNVSDFDPYTPLMNAYQGDSIQIRTLVGAHDRTHAFRLLGNKWLFEPNNPNSGYRTVQDMGISEHFEMAFTLGVGDPGSRGFADWLWESDSTLIGHENGMWGLLRGYTEDPQVTAPDAVNQPAALLKLPNNPNPASVTDILLERWAEVHQTFEDPVHNFKTLPKNYRTFNVVATTANQVLSHLSDGKLYFNTRGQVCGEGDCVDNYYTDSAIYSPFALMYLLETDLEEFSVDKVLALGINPEPLVLRANAGDWIRVRLTNEFEPGLMQTFTTTEANVNALNAGQVPSALESILGDADSYEVGSMVASCAWRVSQTLGDLTNYYYVSRQAETMAVYDSASAFSLSSPQEALSPFNGSANLSQGCLNTSTHVGFNPQLLASDVAQSYGLNVGFNPDQTALPRGGQAEYYWYAGDLQVIDGEVRELPIEFGAINLQSADVMTQYRYGLYAALIIEPEGSIWLEDAGTRASATIFKPKLTGPDFKAARFDYSNPQYRELVLISQENAMLFSDYNAATNPPTSSSSSALLGPPADIPMGLNNIPTLFSDLGLQGYNNQAGLSSLYNYRTEPLTYRYPLTVNGILNTAITATPMSQSIFDKYSNDVLPEPADPETPVFNVGAGTPTRVRWLSAGGVCEQVVTIYGHSWQEEPFVADSTVMGDNPESQEFGTVQYGPNMVYNLNLASAGGKAKTTGDYLITEFSAFAWGDWNLMRVSDEVVVLTEARTVISRLTVAGMVMEGKEMSAGLPVWLEILDSSGNPDPNFPVVQLTTKSDGTFRTSMQAPPPGCYVCARIGGGICGQENGLATTTLIRSTSISDNMEPATTTRGEE